MVRSPHSTGMDLICAYLFCIYEIFLRRTYIWSFILMNGTDTLRAQVEFPVVVKFTFGNWGARCVHLRGHEADERGDPGSAQWPLHPAGMADVVPCAYLCTVNEPAALFPFCIIDQLPCIRYIQNARMLNHYTPLTRLSTHPRKRFGPRQSLAL